MISKIKFLKFQKMPESAEVKLTVDFLSKKMVSKEIVNWIFYKKEDNFLKKYFPLKVEEISCKGKFIYMILFSEKKNKKIYVLHSMMLTGSWRIEKPSHPKWSILLSNNESIWFNDTRGFATLSFTEDETELFEKLNNLGPDILTEELTLEIWKELIEKHKKKNITSFLMDQSIISGCGNYIKAETLYRAKVSPLRKISSLNEEEIKNILEGLKYICREAYKKKGLTIRDYTDENGEKCGSGLELKIYGKSHAKKTKTADGRITHWDESVQK